MSNAFDGLDNFEKEIAMKIYFKGACYGLALTMSIYFIVSAVVILRQIYLI